MSNQNRNIRFFISSAEFIDKLIREHHLTQDLTAKYLGKIRTSVTNLLRLLKLDFFVKDCFLTNKIEMGHARALLSLDSEMQRKLAEEIYTKQLSVRDTEKKLNQF